MIEFVPISEFNCKEVLALELDENQSKWLMSNEKALSKAYIYREQSLFYAISYESVIVGTILLRRNPTLSNYFLWHLMIGKEFQGKGYGKIALEKVIEICKLDDSIEHLVTTCDIDNEIALKFYKKFGFEVIAIYEEEEIDLKYQL